MQISEPGLQKIIQREGVILHAYQDSVGVWTIGTGHTSAAGPPHVSPGMRITKEENDHILLNDLRPIEQQFTEHVHVPVTQNQYDAIISIVFNVGPKFWHSTCIARLNAGDVQGAAQAIMQWSKPREIIGRRRTEQQQFLTPDTTQSSGSTIEDINNKVQSSTSMFNTIKEFFKDNVITNVGVGAGAVSAFFTNHWPEIVVGTIALAALGYLAFYIYERKVNGNSSAA